MYYIIMCPRCGNYQTKEFRIRKQIELIDRSFKCFRCNKTTIMKSKTKAGLNLKAIGPYLDPREATIKCQELKAKQGGN